MDGILEVTYFATALIQIYNNSMRVRVTSNPIQQPFSPIY